MERASIIVDLRNNRCSGCMVALHDELAATCPACGARFDSVSSNHVGLAEPVQQRRQAAGVGSKPAGDSAATA